MKRNWHWCLLSSIALVAPKAMAQCESWAPLTPLGVETAQETVRTMTAWDPDGDGPLPARLVIAGTFHRIGSVECNHIAMYDGVAWRSLAGGADATVRSVTTWDPDGDGPGGIVLVAAGGFVTIGGVSASHIASWDGQTWTPIGPGLPTASLVASWDADGSGAEPPRLVVSGLFPADGDEPAHRFEVWNGSDWQRLSPDPFDATATFRHMRAWDPDGLGPLPEQIVVAGPFAILGPESFIGAARWNGIEWSEMPGLSPQSGLYGLATWPRGEHSPQGDYLYASGSYPPNWITSWDGEQFSHYPPRLEHAPVTSQALGGWDPDGSGPAPRQLVATVATLASPQARYLARWDGSAWVRLGDSGALVVANVMTAWDPDGEGPALERLVVGGAFGSFMDLPQRYLVAAWSVHPQRCAADFDCDDVITSGDFFAFLAALVSLDTSADVNGDGALNSQDLFDFLNEFFAGCGG